MLNPLQNKIREMAAEQLEQQGTVEKQQPVVSDGGFDDILGRLVNDVDSLQKTAESTIQELAAGEDESIQDVGKKMQEADAAYNLMMQIRHKLVDVYSAVDNDKGSDKI